jgi:hypothetical protein
MAGKRRNSPPGLLAQRVLVETSMGRTAGQEARVAGADRAVAGQRVARPSLASASPATSAVRPSPPRPLAALATPAAPLAVKSASAAPPAPPALPAAAAAAAVPRSVEHKTVREILPPWHVLQEKLQNKTAGLATRNEALNQGAQQALEAQEAANARWAPDDSIEIPPSSGVRMSEPGVAAQLSVPGPGEGPDSLLSFKVYTLAELERRSDAPVSMRSSRLSFDLTSSRSSQHWERAFAALKTFANASMEWLKIKGERPKLKVALRQPFDNLGDELQVAVESVDWKKIGVTTGIVVGATLTLLFAVLTAAELTDDLKPAGSATHLATTGIPAKTVLDARSVAPATNMAAMGAQPMPAPIVIEPPPAAAASTASGEIDELAEQPAPVAKKAKKAKPKATKLAVRSAPF